MSTIGQSAPHRIEPLEIFRFGETDLNRHLLNIERTVTQFAEAQTTALQSAQQQGAAEKPPSASALEQRMDVLRTEVSLGFRMLADAMEANTDALHVIHAEISSIRVAVENPRLNSAREAFALAGRWHRQGLHREAEARYLEALSVNDVDFLVHLQIGKLYLAGRSETESLVDLPKAEEHLRRAHRYVKAARVDLGRKIDFVETDTCRNLAFVSFLRASARAEAGDERMVPDPDLLNAVAWLSSAPTPSRADRFFKARCECLTDDPRAALDTLHRLGDEDRSYVYWAQKDPEFSPLAEDISSLLTSLHDTPGPCSSKVNRARDSANREVERICSQVDLFLQGTALTLKERVTLVDRGFAMGEMDYAKAVTQLSAVESGALEARARAVNNVLSRLRTKTSELEGRLTRMKTPDEGGDCWGMLLVLLVVSAAGGLGSGTAETLTNEGISDFLASIVGWVVGIGFIVGTYWIIDQFTSTRKEEAMIGAKIFDLKVESERVRSLHADALKASANQRKSP